MFISNASVHPAIIILHLLGVFRHFCWAFFDFQLAVYPGFPLCYNERQVIIKRAMRGTGTWNMLFESCTARIYEKDLRNRKNIWSFLNEDHKLNVVVIKDY